VLQHLLEQQVCWPRRALLSTACCHT
jgi:hypothetical protein